MGPESLCAIFGLFFFKKNRTFKKDRKVVKKSLRSFCLYKKYRYICPVKQFLQIKREK